MTLRDWCGIAALMAVPVIGCGNGAAPQYKSARFDTAASNDPVAGAKPADKQAAGAAANDQPIARKIIYNASLDVVVKDLDTAITEVEKLVQQYRGYIARSEITGNQGSRRSATWMLKIPSEQFRLAITSFIDLGIPEKNTSDSQDVTEEFLDLEARVKTLKAEEEALNTMLREATNLESILKIRQQITELRGQIEKAEGRLKFLTVMTSLSTITLTLREDAAYVPPSVPQEPTFTVRVEETFTNSMTVLQRLGEGVGLAIVAITPWLPLILILGLLLRWLVRRIITDRSEAVAMAVPVTVEPIREQES